MRTMASRPRSRSDSDRHAIAGATPVILVSETEAAVMWRRNPPKVEELIDIVATDVDVVVIEDTARCRGPKFWCTGR